MMRTNIIGLVFALALAGCEGSEAPWSAEQSATTSQELGAVRGCESQARSCFQAATAPAAMSACQDALRSCLQSIGGDGGGRLLGHLDGGFPDFDGSFPEGGFAGGRFGSLGGHHGFGGGRGFGSGGACGSNLNDAGIPPFGGGDSGGGVVPPGDDGGGVTPPSPVDDAGVAGSACLQTLQQCLASTTPPATCAANAEACLATAQ